MDHIKRPFTKLIGRFKKPSIHQIGLSKAVDRIKEDLDVVYMIQAIRKLQAGVATLLGSDKEQIEHAKEIYYKRLSVDHKQSDDSDEQNLFIKFLDSNNNDVDDEWLQKVMKGDINKLMKNKLNTLILDGKPATAKSKGDVQLSDFNILA